jgi:hypothetical protein
MVLIAWESMVAILFGRRLILLSIKAFRGWWVIKRVIGFEPETLTL